MIKAQHDEHVYAISSFNTAYESINELASNVYKKVNGWEEGSALAGFPLEELLEIVDRVRIPLAEKKFDGQKLSIKEESYLDMMELLTDKILNSMAPTPEEPDDVKSAMLHAKRLLQGM
jgi:hypothetical protein